MIINWVFIIVVVLFAWNIRSGWRRGLVRMLYRFVSTVLSVLLSIALVVSLGDAIREATPFYGMLENWAENLLISIGSENILTALITSADMLTAEIAAAAALAIFNILLFFIIFIIVRMILGFVNGVVLKLSKLPVLSTVNRLAGAAAGALNGLLTVWILFTILELMSGTAIGNSAQACISGMRFLEEINSRNLIRSAVSVFLI